MAFDEIAIALGTRARRHVLRNLLEHNPVSQQAVVSELESRSDEKLDVEFVHVHLPKLDRLEYIDWDRDRGQITKGPKWPEIEPILRLLSDNKDRVPADTF